MEPLVHEFGSDAIAVLEFPAEVSKEGLTVTHPTLGLLSWHEPLPLLRSIHARMEIVERRKRIRVPPGGASAQDTSTKWLKWGWTRRMSWATL